MVKKSLRMEVITAYRDLLSREMKGPADAEGAMHRIQSKYGLDYWVQWGLRFRPPKKITTDLSERVRQAYLAAIESSVRKDLARLQIEIARDGDDAALESLVSEAQDLLARIAQKKVG